MNTLAGGWMPSCRSVSLLPAGKWWDAVKVPRAIALEALEQLRDETGAVIEDPWSCTFYWLVPAGRATTWQFSKTAQIKVLGDTTHIVVPGPECTVGPQWRVPPTGSSALTNPEKLHDALARAVAIVDQQSPDEAYRLLLAHYNACAGCAHDGKPCGEQCTHETTACRHGRQLRQAWVSVRWS